MLDADGNQRDDSNIGNAPDVFGDGLCHATSFATIGRSQQRQRG